MAVVAIAIFWDTSMKLPNEKTVNISINRACYLEKVFWESSAGACTLSNRFASILIEIAR